MSSFHSAHGDVCLLEIEWPLETPFKARLCAIVPSKKKHYVHLNRIPKQFFEAMHKTEFFKAKNKRDIRHNSELSRAHGWISLASAPNSNSLCIKKSRAFGLFESQYLVAKFLIQGNFLLISDGLTNIITLFTNQWK